MTTEIITLENQVLLMEIILSNKNTDSDTVYRLEKAIFYTENHIGKLKESLKTLGSLIK